MNSMDVSDNDSPVKQAGVQPLSIHFVNTARVCSYFRIEEAEAELKDLINRIVRVYNKTFNDGKEQYNLIDDWKTFVESERI